MHNIRKPRSVISQRSAARPISRPGALATLICGAQAVGKSRFAAPHLAAVITDIGEDAATMIRAVVAGRPSDGEPANRRLTAIRAAGLLEPSAWRRWRA